MKRNYTKYRRNIVIMDEATEYKKYLEALKKATEAVKEEKKNKPKPIKLNSGSKKKMPKARDAAMMDKNIVYLGDPFMVDGKMFDPVKADPETYLRPKDAKTYSTGGDVTVTKGGDYIKDLID